MTEIGEKGDWVIVTERVTKEYSDNGVGVVAVNGVDLKIARGEFTAIVGPSGSGKTTFLNLISGLDSVTSGKIWLNGKPLSEMTGGELSDFRRDNIGFIFQAYNLIPVLTVEENIEYIMLLQHVPPDRRRPGPRNGRRPAGAPALAAGRNLRGVFRFRSAARGWPHRAGRRSAAPPPCGPAPLL